LKDFLEVEPFTKVLEWCDSQVNMEEVYRFPLLRLKPADVSSPFVISAKVGVQRRANGETGGKLRGNAVNRIVPDLDSRFRGNDGKWNCAESRPKEVPSRDRQSPDWRECGSLRALRLCVNPTVAV